MCKRLLSLLLFPLFLAAAELEVLSGSVDSNGTVMKATGDVIVLYEDMMIAAKKMVYNKSAHTIDFSGDVHMIRGSSYYLIGKTLHMNTLEKSSVFKPLFLHEKETHVWFSGEKSVSKDGQYELYDAIVSSCNPIDPEWRIGYSSGVYDSKEKWVDLYNIVVYAGDVPFLYFPYFGFTTDRTRTTGFLLPTIGYSKTEGFFYEQPFYIATSDNSDIELKYQNRAKRGQGIFADFRFVDSYTSKGNINVGYFKEENEDSTIFGWSNKEHYGIDIDYDRTHLFDKKFSANIEDQLFADIKLYNDVDYVNMQSKKNRVTDTSTILTSRINYNINSDDHYLGLYGKYFFDTTAQTSVTSLQEAPKLQYHKYLDTLLVDNITYSVDYKMTNRARQELVNAYENVITAPVTYSMSLFDEYINISLTEDITMSSISFRQTEGNSSYEDGSYVSLSQTLTVDTDLIKKYENGAHAIRLGASYLFPGSERKSGFYENKYGQFDDQDCQTGELCEFVQGSIDQVDKTINLELTQYLFDASGKEWFYHKIKQPISVEDNTTLGILENELRLRLWNRVTLYSDLFYNRETENLDKVSSSISYQSNALTTSLTHLFQDQPHINKESDYYTFKVKYRPGNHYTYTAEYAYDDILKESRNWLASVEMKKRCWSYSVGFSENVIPTSSSSITEQYLSFSVNLIPIAGVSYDYQLSRESE